MKNRVKYFDIARGVGIILVIIGHVQFIPEGLQIFISSFHMPLFFIMSGMLTYIAGGGKKPLGKTAGKKLFSIMLPYLCYSVLDIIAYLIYSSITHTGDGMVTVGTYIKQTLTLYGISVEWFLPALFGAELIFLSLLKLMPSAAAFALCGGLAFAVPTLHIHINEWNAAFGATLDGSALYLFVLAVLRMAIGSFFVAAGYIIQSIISYLESKNGREASPWFLMLCGIILFCICAALGGANGVVDLHFLVFGNPVLYALSALSGSLALIAICRCLESCCDLPPFQLLSYYGRGSIIIMATHIDFYVLYLCEVAAVQLYPKFPDSIRDGCFITAIVIFVLIAETALIGLIEKFCPLLAGKWRPHGQ